MACKDIEAKSEIIGFYGSDYSQALKHKLKEDAQTQKCKQDLKNLNDRDILWKRKHE